MTASSIAGEVELRGGTAAGSLRGVRYVFRAERRKLAAQLPTRLLAVACGAGPVAFTAVLKAQSAVPADTLFGRWVHTSGFAVPLVVLGFAGSWGFPIIAGVLAGDIFASEDRYGTWKTVLTRSCSRRDLFAGKVLAAITFSVALALLAWLSSLAAGVLLIGDQPLVSLSGTVLSSPNCLVLVLASWAISVLPIFAFVSLAVLFSVLTRNGIAGVVGPVLVGLAMQLLALIGTGVWVHTLLVASAFDGWHGLLASPRFYRPLIFGSVVSIAWTVVCLYASWWVLRRRDVASPPAARRSGWRTPLALVLGGAALLAGLAVASSWGPAAVTSARLEAAIKPTFNRLTLLQQRLLGRTVLPGATLNDVVRCARHNGTGQGSGDDWVCTLNVLIPGSRSPTPQFTPVDYDITVKSNGCYKAEGPPSFIGPQTIVDAHGQAVVNPLFGFDGCFDTT